MRLRMNVWVAAVLAAAVVVLAGCSGGSMVPGIGTDGGLGTIGGGTGNPDETLVMRVKGSKYQDFVAATVRLSNPPDTRAIEAKQEAGITNAYVLRTISIRFASTPVEGQSYTVGATGANAAAITYIETSPPGALTGKQWVGASGTVKITRLNADRMDGVFSAALVPDVNATGNLTLTGGVFHLKF